MTRLAPDVKLVIAGMLAGVVCLLLGTVQYARSAPADDRFAHVQQLHPAAASGVRARRRVQPSPPIGGFFAGDPVSVARSYIGTNPTGQRRQWCADFVNLVERRLGRPGTGSRLAASYLRYGAAVSTPAPGDIALIARGRRVGHVGYVSGLCDRGVMIVSGNHRRTTGEACYPQARIVRVVRP